VIALGQIRRRRGLEGEGIDEGMGTEREEGERGAEAGSLDHLWRRWACAVDSGRIVAILR